VASTAIALPGPVLDEICVVTSVQAPLLHAPETHAWPHWPQLFASTVRSVQTFAQTVGALLGQWQTAFVQTAPSGHSALMQPPQCIGSLLSSTHA
jgi:hypothetical protein